MEAPNALPIVPSPCARYNAAIAACEKGSCWEAALTFMRRRGLDDLNGDLNGDWWWLMDFLKMIWFIFPMEIHYLGHRLRQIQELGHSIRDANSSSQPWVEGWFRQSNCRKILPYVREVSSFGGTSSNVRSICDSETCLEFNELRSVWNGKTMLCFGSSLYCIPRCLRKSQFSTSGWNSHFPVFPRLTFR